MADLDYRHPDWPYVASLLNELKWELQGLHQKISDIEALKYYEDNIQLPKPEKRTNQEIRVGLTADLTEQVKAAILANSPSVHIEGHRKTKDAGDNASKREHYWQDHIDKMLGGDNAPNYISELCDAQMLGVGILKSAKSMSRWELRTLKRKRNETAAEHLDRVEGYKKLWGHPSAAVIVHPLSAFFRPGVGSRVDEVVEHSYKSKRGVFQQYDLTAAQITGDVSGIPGQPDTHIRPLPAGVDTTQYVLVTEYWNPNCYQVYVNGQKVYYEDGEPSVRYFLAPGRTSSSKDPDKYGISIAENLRHNEPLINRLLTRMIEAAELIVNKRNTLEVPESFTPQQDQDEETGNLKPRTWTFTDEYAEALPPGAKIVDPFMGANQVYEAMPLVQLLMQVASQHGVSPLFKGISPGSAGSGYRDNSLYLMAKNEFQYIIGSLQACLTAYITWQEWLLVHHIKQEVWSGNWSLKPSDIKDYPATVKVILKPTLPQNLIAEGEFWARQQAAGNVSRRYAREHGLNLEQPGEMEKEADLEQMKELLKPYLFEDVISTVLGVLPSAQQGEQAGGEEGGPEESRTLAMMEAMGKGAAGGPNGGGRGMGREMGREMGGRATGGQPKQPATEPAEFPPRNQENR